MLKNNGYAKFGIIVTLLLVGLVSILSVFYPASSMMPLFLILIPVIFIIAFTNTDFALIVLIFAMLLSPEIGLGGGIPGRNVVIRLDDIFLFIIFFGWLAKMAVNKEVGLLRVTFLNKPIIFYVFICIVSSCLGALRGTTNPVHTIFYILKYIEYFIVFFMVSNNIKDKNQVKLFTDLILLTCVIVCIYGSYLSLIKGVRATAPFEGIGEANTLAGYLIVMGGLVLGLFVYASASFRKRFLLAGLFSLVLFTLIYTLSRSGWVGFGFMLVSFTFFSKRSRIFMIFAIVCGVLILPLVLPQRVYKRVDATFKGYKQYRIFGKLVTLDESTGARIRSFEYSVKQWLKNPILGQGVPGADVSDVQYGRILREVGIVGFLSFVWIIWMVFKTGLRSYFYSNMDGFGRGLSVGLISALVGLLIMGLGAEFFIIIRIMEPFWFLAAIVSVLPETNLVVETSPA
ncbi:MAG: O-antigen ligase family protein [Candidatus Omnitrophota bacterium]